MKWKATNSRQIIGSSTAQHQAGKGTKVKAKKRFIAGASCPQCSQQDTLRWWIDNNIELVECVDCDYTEQRKPQSVEKINTQNKK